MRARTYLFEVSPRVNGVPQTIHLAGVNSVTGDDTQLNGFQWEPCITQRHKLSMSWAQNGQLVSSSTSWGNITFYCSPDFSNYAWLGMDWDGALGRVWVGHEGDPFSSYVQVFEGSVSNLTTGASTATVQLKGPESALATPILSASYGGTGGPDGDAGMMGKLKPRAFGFCQSVAPTSINAASLVYQVHGYGPCAIPSVYAYAQSLGASSGDYPDYASLVAATIPAGGWATCQAQGMFRLQNQPSKKLSADVVAPGASTIGTIIPQLLTAAGVPAARISDMSAFNKAYNLYQTEQADVGDVVRDAAMQAGLLLYATGTGVWKVVDYYAPAAPTTVNEDQSSYPLVTAIEGLNANGAIWRVNVGHDRCWNVHSEDDVSPALSQLSDAQLAQAEAIKTAQKQADLAVAQAKAANDQIAVIVSDGYLSRAEKAGELLRFQNATAEAPGLLNQGTTYNVTNERAAYLAAFNDLKGYLNGLSPALSDLTQDTPVVGSTYLAKWNAYMQARAALDIALTGIAGTISTWTGVSGVGKPADNATNTALPTTAFGNQGKTVADITTAINTIQQNPSLDTTPPAVPTGLSIGSTVSPQGNSASLVFGWNAVSDSDLAYYELQAGLNGSAPNTIYQGSSTSYLLNGLQPNIPVKAQVRAVDKAGNVSAWSAQATGTTAKDTTPPGPTQNINVNYGLGSFGVTWTNPSDADLAGVTVYWSPDANFAHVTGSATVNAKPGAAGGYTLGATAGTTLYFWSEAFDTSGNKSSLNGPVYTRIPDLTLDASKLTGTIATGQLNGQTVASVLATSGLTPPLAVNKANINDGSVTAIAYAQTALNAYDGKLYRNADGGRLSTSWLPVYTDASSVAGQIVTTQITDSAVTSLKLAGKSVVAGKLDADAVTAGTIAAAAISTRELQSGSITASKLAVVADNLNPDPLFQDINLYNQVSADNTSGGTVSYPFADLNGAHGWYRELNQSYLTSINGPAYGVSLYDQVLTRKDTRNHLYQSPPTIIPMVGGKTYELSAFVHNASSQAAYVQVDLFKWTADPNNANNPPVLTYTGVSPSFNVAPYAGSVNQSAAFTAPVGTAGGRVVVFNYGQAYGATAFVGSITLGNVQVREQLGGTMIIDGSLTAAKIKAGEITATQIAGGTITGDKINSSTSLPGQIQVDGSGWVLSNIRDASYDPAARVNNGPATLITSGKISLSGGTTLSAWQYGGGTTLDGNSIQTNTITANKVVIGTRGVQLIDITFDTNRQDTVSWSAGYVEWQDENNNRQVSYMRAGSQYYDPNNPVAIVWVWFDRSTSPNAFGDGSGHLWSGMPGGGAAEVLRNTNNVILACYRYGNNLVVYNGKTIIDGDYIKTGTVNADRLIANSVLANTITVQGQGSLNDIANRASSGSSAATTGASGSNRLPFSGFEAGSNGGAWTTPAYNPAGTGGDGGAFVYNGKKICKVGATFSNSYAADANQQVSIESTNRGMQFWAAVAPGERIWAGALVETANVAATGILIFARGDGSNQQGVVICDGFAPGGFPGNPDANWGGWRAGCFATVPPDCTKAAIRFYAHAQNSGGAFMSLAEPMICGVTAQQTAWPNYTPGPTGLDPAQVINANQTTIDGAMITTGTIKANNIYVGGISTANLANNAVTVGDFVSSSSSFQGQGGVYAGVGYYQVDGVTYYS